MTLSGQTAVVTGPLSGSGIVVLDVLPGLVRTGFTLRMPVWADRPGQVLDAPGPVG